MYAKKPVDIIRINLFGTGCTIAAGLLENPVQKKIQSYLNYNKITLEEVLSDYRHLHWLEIDKVRRWQDFGTDLFVSGLCVTASGFVEFKINSNKRLKVPLSDIYYQYSLFPVYNKQSEQIDVSEKTTARNKLVVVETIIGKTGSLELSTKNFDIEKLLFDFKSIKVADNISYIVLVGMNYEGKKLKLKKPDVLVNGFYALLI